MQINDVTCANSWGYLFSIRCATDFKTYFVPEKHIDWCRKVIGPLGEKWLDQGQCLIFKDLEDAKLFLMAWGGE